MDWLIYNIIFLALVVGVVFTTNQWLGAEKKLAKFGQSVLYKRIKNNRLYKKCENFFKTHSDDNK